MRQCLFCRDKCMKVAPFKEIEDNVATSDALRSIHPNRRPDMENGK